MNFEKKQKLEEDGYFFDSELKCYVNKMEGKVFSSKWVDQNNQNTLQVAMYTPHSETIWKIYLNPDQPHEEIRSAFFEKYGKTP
jgi:hypothetical protein